MYFGESEVLVAAKHLLIDDRVHREDCEEVTYVHILFDQHEVILAESAPTESFHPGQLGLDGIDEAAREELFMIFPELRTNPNGFGKAARQSLKSFEAQLLLGWAGVQSARAMAGASRLPTDASPVVRRRRKVLSGLVPWPLSCVQRGPVLARANAVAASDGKPTFS
jgi:hypothetical protein